MEPVTVAVVIPTLDEEDCIAAVVGELPRPPVSRVIVADGGSRDATVARALAAGAEVITPGAPGYGRACHDGARAAAGAGIIVFMDGDGADRGDLLQQLTAPIAAGQADFVIASRTRGQRDPGAMSWHQLLAGWLAGFGIRLLTGVRYSDMCAFRAIRGDALARLDLVEMTYGWNIEMQMRAAQQQLRIIELPLPYRRRAGGRSKVAGSLRGSLRAAGRILATFARVAARPAQGNAAR